MRVKLMGRWQGNHFSCRQCGISIGTFRKDQETGKKIPVYNEKHCGDGQYCKSCKPIKN
jgi:hypothetical protein